MPLEVNMSAITFILGGVRSGKSTYALREANRYQGIKTFIATAEGRDKEMAERIERHRNERGPAWETFEEPLDIKGTLNSLPGAGGVVVIDCLTLWVSNLLDKDEDPQDEFDRLVSALLSCPASLIYIVSNEVGMGVVPDHPLGRVYRDQLGLLNRKIAEIASRVILMIAGIPMEIKSDG
jgi:adenosylcobinamide kinase/adenosylcobinamide-phosphate guanylyltransferase